MIVMDDKRNTFLGQQPVLMFKEEEDWRVLRPKLQRGCYFSSAKRTQAGLSWWRRVVPLQVCQSLIAAGYVLI
jgi:hypothetical protein